MIFGSFQSLLAENPIIAKKKGNSHQYWSLLHKWLQMVIMNFLNKDHQISTWYTRTVVLLLGLAPPDSDSPSWPLNMLLPLISFNLYPEHGFLQKKWREWFRWLRESTREKLTLIYEITIVCKVWRLLSWKPIRSTENIVVLYVKAGVNLLESQN